MGSSGQMPTLAKGLPARYPARALDQAGVGALAVDQEELATLPGGDQRLAFQVGGLLLPEVPAISRERLLQQPGDDNQAALVGPAQVAVDPHQARAGERGRRGGRRPA